jgi:hypothetical protein
MNKVEARACFLPIAVEPKGIYKNANIPANTPCIPQIESEKKKKIDR